jgi:hypothetical protein
MRHLRCHALIALRWVFLSMTLATVGCSGATYIRAAVPDNPIEKVAQLANADWSVERVDPNTLRLRNSWPIHSVLSLGYSATYANLFYNAPASELDLQYYFKSYQLPLLFIPFSIDAEPGFTGAALKPTMNEQIEKILRWSGATVKSRRAGSTSEPFPP